MPYYIKEAITKNDVVTKLDFEPEIDREIKRRFSLGKHLTDEEIAQVPRKICIGGVPSIGIPDIWGWMNGPYVISSQLRNKIEELESDVHGFVPIHVIGRSENKTDYGTFYLLHLTQALDAVAPEETNFHEGIGLEAAKASTFKLNSWQGPYVLCRTQIEGRHLWRGAGPGDRWNDYYCSDELGDFIKENKLRGWKLLRCDVKVFPEQEVLYSTTGRQGRK